MARREAAAAAPVQRLRLLRPIHRYAFGGCFAQPAIHQPGLAAPSKACAIGIYHGFHPD